MRAPIVEKSHFGGIVTATDIARATDIDKKTIELVDAFSNMHVLQRQWRTIERALYSCGVLGFQSRVSFLKYRANKRVACASFCFFEFWLVLH